VIQEYLMVIEQTGPRHTNVQVLQCGDELRPLQALMLPGVVTSAPVMLGEIVYLPTDRGCVRMVRCQATAGERPFSDNGEFDVSDGQPRHNTELQLAAAQGKLWVGGGGVRIFEPGADGTPPALVQRLWEDLRVTQPLQVEGEIVIGAGRVADRAGVEVRAWGLATGETLWSCTLAVPPPTPPSVRAEHGYTGLSSADATVGSVPETR